MCHIDWSATGAMLSGISAIIIAIIAYCALYTAKSQIYSSQRSAALQLICETFKVEIQHPELAAPDKSGADLEGNENYISFVSYFAFVLSTYEEILWIAEKTKESAWSDVIYENLKIYGRHILNQYNIDNEYFQKSYNKYLNTIIDKVIISKLISDGQEGRANA